MNKHFQLTQDDTGISWLFIDKADSKVNTLSADVMEELDHRLIHAAQQHPRGLVIASAKPTSFIAGADVKAFARIRNKTSAQKLIDRGHDIFNRIASLPFPTVALIRGHCLGGGLELALACDYRVASDDLKTRLGFPEVRLGIFPGFGGTVRSIQKLGHLKAMELMLSGRQLSARTAKSIGLVDYAGPEWQLHNAAHALIMHQPPVFKPSWAQRLAGTWPARPLVAAILKKQLGKKVNPEHYPAPYRLIDHWNRHAGQPVAMYASEAHTVSELITSDSAQNLIRVFMLQDRLKSMASRKDLDPQHVHVVGGGVMGGDIAAWCALKGMRVTLQDRAPEHITQAIQRAHALFKRKLRNPYLYQAASDRLMGDHQGLGVSKADVVIEAIYEDVAAKQELYATLEPRLKPAAVLATNTSSIPLQFLSQKLADPQRLVGLHFFNPVAKMPLIEIVSTEHTDPDMAKKASAFALHLGKLPLPVKSSPGFLVNRVLLPYLLEAVELIDEGVPAVAIDKAAVNFGMPMGPVELADTVGLDICLSVASKMSDIIHNQVPASLSDLVEQGHLGRKSGHGYYKWEKGKPTKPALPRAAEIPADLEDRLILRLINESIACLREGVVADEDLLDAGIIFGTGFAPFRGGPLHYVHEQGSEAVQKRLHRLEYKHGEHFHAARGWAMVG
jgi:3-hydroxyacyl-CoA dehydrogenase/enoyl-CoA hydratase/3-hydroxybutyryl-CoA epimerase